MDSEAKKPNILETLVGMAILAITIFSIAFLLIFCPMELYDVYQVSHWDEVRAEVISSGITVCGFREDAECLEIVIKDLTNDKVVKVGDEMPGDLPLSVNVGLIRKPVWSSLAATALKYKVGSEIVAFRSPDKQKYYLQRGDYALISGIAGLSFLWLLGLYLVAKIIGVKKTA
jgi:hypothetical protein